LIPGVFVAIVVIAERLTEKTSPKKDKIKFCHYQNLRWWKNEL